MPKVEQVGRAAEGAVMTEGCGMSMDVASTDGSPYDTWGKGGWGVGGYCTEPPISSETLTFLPLANEQAVHPPPSGNFKPNSVCTLIGPRFRIFRWT